MGSVPTRYPVYSEVSEGAQLALGLLDADIIDADDYEPAHDPASFIARSLGRLWTPDAFERFSLDYTFATHFDQLYFHIKVTSGDYLDFSQPAQVCDRAHEALGPSLLTHLYATTPLLPAFTPEVCRGYIETFHWEDSEQAEYLLEMARNDLAAAREVEEESLSDEEVEAYADQHYLTPSFVDGALEPRYQQPGLLPLKACRELCRRHGFGNLLSACDLLLELRTLKDALPERSESFFERTEHYTPYAVVVGLQGEGERDLVDEIYREYEQQTWEGGEFGPVYALEVDPRDPETLRRLKTALETCRRSLELTEKLYATLEVTKCLFP